MPVFLDLNTSDFIADFLGDFSTSPEEFFESLQTFKIGKMLFFTNFCVLCAQAK